MYGIQHTELAKQPDLKCSKCKTAAKAFSYLADTASERATIPEYNPFYYIKCGKCGSQSKHCSNLEWAVEEWKKKAKKKG